MSVPLHTKEKRVAPRRTLIVRPYFGKGTGRWIQGPIERVTRAQGSPLCNLPGSRTAVIGLGLIGYRKADGRLERAVRYRVLEP